MKLRLKIFHLFIFCSLCIQLNAQEINSRSVYTNIISTFEADTGRIFKLISTAEKVKLIHPDSSFKLLNEALVASKQLKFNDGIGNSLLALGVLHVNRGNFEAGEAYLQGAIPYCQRAIARKEMLTMLYNAIAVLNCMESKHSLSLYFFFKALEEIKINKIENPNLVSMIYSNIGLIWMRQRQYEQAKYYLKKAEKIAIDNKLYDNLAKTYVVMSGVCIQDDKPVPGRMYAIKGIELSKPYYDSVSQYCALINLAVSYKDEPRKALDYYKQAIDFSTGNPYYSNSDPYIGIASIYYELKEFKSAEKYLLAAHNCATKNNMPESRQYASKGLALVYFNLKDYHKAYEYQELYSAISDSMTNAKQISANHEWEVKYRTTEKDKELMKKQLLITQQKNLLNSKNIWIGGIAIGSLLLVMLLIGINMRYRHRQQVQTKELQIVKQQQEINELRATIKGEEKERARLGRELHDGIGGLISAFTISFNTLGEENRNLQNTKAYQKALYLLGEMSTEVRKTSHNMMPEVLLHHSLPDAVRHFCDYMQHSSKKADLQIDVQSFGMFDVLDRELMLSSYRIIQELVQNVVKHANATHAVVQLILRDHILSITVEDNGIGFETDVEGDGMGLLNLKSRIKSMNGSLVLESFKNRGTSVFIEFDLNKKEIIA